MAALLAAHPCLVNGTELRESLVERGVQFGPAFAGLAAAHTAEAGVSTVLAEVGLPGSIRFQQAAYRVHPALLDACFQSVAAHPASRPAAVAACCCRWVCAAYVPTVLPATPATATRE